MATYIQGSRDYIPQLQPFQPDYNFLGNILQKSQTQYDQNYKQLSRTYGNLLNSPMLRDDTNNKRQEFFKMIDQDIKRISQMDLSLQQNVDAANTVFDSFFQNKDMVKDMVFTKQYHKQLQRAENFKNCTDQEECGGKYWDVGVNALNYRAEEFKNASKEEMMNMTPGEFTPMVNIQEKAAKIAKEMFGDKGAFGPIQRVVPSPDGRYRITLKNGALLQVPLQQFLMNQFSKDQSIIDMFETQAYVDRKNYVKQNAERFGSEDLAEDDYFRQLDVRAQQTRQMLEEVNGQLNENRTKKELLESKIKREGSNGEDQLAIDFAAAGINEQTAAESYEILESETKIINSIYEGNLDRKTKRRVADSVMARGFMNNELMNAATIIANMTGSEEVEEDKYALNAFEHGLQVQRMKLQSSLNKDEKIHAAVIDAMFKNPNSGTSNIFSPTGNDPHSFHIGTDVWKNGTVHLGSGEGIKQEDPWKMNEEDLQKTRTNIQGRGIQFVKELASDLMGTYHSMNPNDSEEVKSRNYASNSLIKLFGEAKKKDGKYVQGGFDKNTGKFVDQYGNSWNSIEDAFSNQSNKAYGEANWYEFFKKGKALTQEDGALQEDFMSRKGNKLLRDYDNTMDVAIATENVFKENVRLLRNKVKSDIAGSKGWFNKKSVDVDLRNFDLMFNEQGLIRTQDQFKEALVNSLPEKEKQWVGMYDYDALAKREYDQFMTVLKENYNKDAVDGLKTTQSIPGMEGVGGVGTAGSMSWESLSTQWGHPAMANFFDFYKDFTGGNAQAAAARIYEDGEMPVETDEGLKLFLNTLYSDVMMNNDKDKAYWVRTEYFDLAGGDPNKIAIKLNVSPEFFKKHKDLFPDDETAIGTVSKADILSNGVYLYSNRDMSSSRAKDIFKRDDMSFVMSQKDKTIKVPGVGHFIIRKQNPDQSFTIHGGYWGIDDQTGKKVWKKGSYTTSPNANGLNVYNGVLLSMENAHNMLKQLGKTDVLYSPEDFANLYEGGYNPYAQQQSQMGGYQQLYQQIMQQTSGVRSLMGL